MPTTVEQLIQQMEWAAARGLSELTTTLDGRRLTILRESIETRGDAAGTVSRHENIALAEDTDSAATDAITAPLAGLCHLAAESGGSPFVAAGQVVDAGQTLCMIEAMKMMTPVTAMGSGTVREILVEDGAPVQAGAPLMRLS